MKQKKEILMPHGKRTELANDFNVTYVTVNAALNFRTDSLLARKIRIAAIERGGMEFDPDRRKRAK